MPVNVACACGAAYTLKDEYAGAQLACPKCGAVIAVPALPPAPPVHAQAGDPAFARDKFLLNQKHLAIREKYIVADEAGAPLMYVERPRYIFLNVLAIFGGITAGFAALVLYEVLCLELKKAGIYALMIPFPRLEGAGAVLLMVVFSMAFAKKRHVTVYRDETKKEILLRTLQDRKIQLLSAWFTVTDPQGKVAGRMGKKYLRNILRKRWYGYGPDGTLLFIAKEDSIILSILRRFMGSFFGLLRTDFIIYGTDGNILGEFNRKFTILDRYVLDMSGDHLRSVDRRLALALGVLLDTGEHR